MSVGIVLFEVNELEPLVRWAAKFAEARHQGLVILQVLRRIGDETRVEITNLDEAPEHLKNVTQELSDGDFKWAHIVEQEVGEEKVEQQVEAISPADNAAEKKLPLNCICIQGTNLLNIVQREVQALEIELLIVPRDPAVKVSSEAFSMERQLLSDLKCEVLQLSVGHGDGRRCGEILAPVSESAHSKLAFSQAHDLAMVTGARVTALYVERQLDDVAQQVGQRILGRSLPSLSSDVEVAEKVVIANQVDAGVIESVTPAHDLIVLGRQHHGLVHRLLFRSVSEAILQADPGPAIAIIQDELPLASQLLRNVDQTVKTYVPQLDRERRVRLVDRIQSSSLWNFDFIALISLSTLIAAGGLIQNSPAVVIGAMLVAPLMTPLLGTGLSLVQGNLIMFRDTITTVLRGFILAFVIGCGMGLLFRNSHPTSEMIARGSPGVLDLLVAFVSGIAAAYANGRPNLLSALPGVAIAASLVPPIATSGIAVVQGEFPLAQGAALLFFTNIVAIILGTACSFWGVGIRGSHHHSQFNKWAVGAFLVIVVLTVSLAVIESWPAKKISAELQNELNSMLLDQAATCESISWKTITKDGTGGDRSGLEVAVVSRAPLSERAEQAIATLLRRSFEQDTPIRIRTELHSVIDEPQRALKNDGPTREQSMKRATN